MITYVWIKTDFVAFHRWAEAPAEVAYLRDYHRHKFFVTLRVIVKESREVEFHMLKKKVDDYTKLHYKDRCFDLSCEQIATNLLRQFSANKVTVSEDDECGATVVDQTPDWHSVTSFVEVASCLLRGMAVQPRDQPPTSWEETARIWKEKATQAYPGTWGCSHPIQPSTRSEWAKQEAERIEKEIIGNKLAKVHNTVRTKVFIGVEAEGPRRGQATLFVPGSCSLRDFHVYWNKSSRAYPHIYYGAGNDRQLKPNTAEEILRIAEYTNKLVTIEGPEADMIWLNQLRNRYPAIMDKVYLVQFDGDRPKYIKNGCLEPNLYVCDFAKWMDKAGVIIWQSIVSPPLIPSIYTTQFNDELFLQDKEVI